MFHIFLLHLSHNQRYMRRVVLDRNEREKLEYLQKHSSNSVERNRRLCLLLSDKGNSMSKVAKLVNIHWITVSRLITAWEQADAQNRFSVLRQAQGQGAKKKLGPISDKIPDLLDKHNRNLDLVLQEIQKQFGIIICKLTLQNFLKDAGLYVETNTKIVKK